MLLIPKLSKEPCLRISFFQYRNVQNVVFGIVMLYNTDRQQYEDFFKWISREMVRWKWMA